MKSVFKRMLGRKVLGGPFAGMPYIGYSSGSTLMPKILGTYEKELHPLLARLDGRLKQTVVVVGAAEGYYAVGFLRSHPALKVVAFESSEEGRTALAELARLNAVSDRLTIRGSCAPADLQQVLTTALVDLVLMDVEGYEKELLDLEAVPGLWKTAVLVELHDSPNLVMSDVLESRFSSSHHIERIAHQPRVPEDINVGMYRMLARISSSWRHALLWERADDAGWLYLEPQIQPPPGSHGRA